MYKKILAGIVVVAAVVGAWFAYRHFAKNEPAEQPRTQEKAATAQTFDDETVYAYKAGELSEDCAFDSEMACAVDFAVKCTLEPTFKGCADSKLPRFIFMTDESLNRPTEMTLRLVKIKPINADRVEIHTDGTCNGNWFGLCQGRIIYSLVSSDKGWRVQDIYAIERL
jgi:hypothetical protein